MTFKIQHAHTDDYINSLDINKIKGAIIVDLGCGDGYAAKKFYNLKAKSVYGVDHNLRQDILLAKNHVTYVNDMSQIKDNVDIIWCHHCIEHVFNPIDFIRKIYDRLKLGGELWIGCPNSFHNPNIFSPGHIHNYNAVTLISQLRIVGFNVTDASWWWYKGQLRVRVKKEWGDDLTTIFNNISKSKYNGKNVTKLKLQFEKLNTNYYNYPRPFLEQLEKTGRINLDLLVSKYNW